MPKMPKYKYVEEYTDGSEEEDEEVIIVPYVKPPPPMIVLSASEEEEELATHETNDKQKQSSKKASRSKKNISSEQRDSDVSNNLSGHSMSESNNEIAHKKSSTSSKRSRVSKSKRRSNDEDQTNREGGCDDLPEKYISIGVTSNEQKTVAESSQNVESSGDVIPVPSCQNLRIGANTPALSSRIVTDSSMSLSSRGDSEMDRDVEEEVHIPPIHISTTISQSNHPQMRCSVANKNLQGNVTQLQAQGRNNEGVGEKNPNKTTKKRTSSAQEQSHSDVLKFIQHLGLPLKELPSIDTPVQRNANAPSSRSKAKSRASATATSTSNPSQAESGSGEFVSTAEDVIADRSKKKGKSGKTKQSESVNPEDDSYTPNQLETTSSTSSSKATSKVNTSGSNKRKSNTSPTQARKKRKTQSGQSPNFAGGSGMNESTENNILNNPDGIFPKKWGNNLRDFYGRVIRDLPTEEIQDKQSGQNKKRKTSEDRTGASDWIRCSQCRQYGHTRSVCSEKNKPTVCSMCGRKGHISDSSGSCPKAICLNCGTPQRNFQAACGMCIYHKPKPVQCRICHVVGHTDKLCPDSWRRYHSTIEDPSTIDRITEDILRLGFRDEALQEQIDLAVQETRRDKHYLTSSRRRLAEKSTRKELQLTEERKRVINQLNNQTRIYKKLQAKTMRSRLEASKGGSAESQSKKIYKPLFAVYCSNCGVQGHTFFKCGVRRYNTICQPNKPFVVQELPNLTPITSPLPDNHLYQNETSTQLESQRLQPGSRVILLNEDEYTHLQRAIQDNKTDALFAKYKKRNVNIDISKDSREFYLTGDEKGMDEARLAIFRMLIPFTSQERARKAVSNVAKILRPDRKSSSDSGGTKNTSTRVRQPLITNEEVIEELDEIVPIPQGNLNSIGIISDSLKEKHPSPPRNNENQDKTSIPSPSVGIRNLGREADMFDIDERVMTSNEKLAAEMKSMFHQQSPFNLSINSQKEFVPVLVPVPMAEYESYISGKVPLPDFVTKFGVPPTQASSGYYFPELLQVPSANTEKSTEFGQTRSKPENPGRKAEKPEQGDKTEEDEPTVPPQLRDASPDIEIIHEVAPQAESSGSEAEGSKSEPRKLNNLKNVEQIKLLPSQFLLFCDNKTDILKQITAALNVTISISESDFSISIKGRNPEKRKIAHENILNFIQSKGGEKEFTLCLERQSPSPHKLDLPSSTNSAKSSSDRVPNDGKGSVETESDFPDFSTSRESDERRNEETHNNPYKYHGPTYSRHVPNSNYRNPRDDYAAPHGSYNNYYSRHQYNQGPSSSYSRGNRYYSNYNNRYSRRPYTSGYQRYYNSNYTRGHYNNNY